MKKILIMFIASLIVIFGNLYRTWFGYITLAFGIYAIVDYLGLIDLLFEEEE